MSRPCILNLGRCDVLAYRDGRPFLAQYIPAPAFKQPVHKDTQGQRFNLHIGAK